MLGFVVDVALFAADQAVQGVKTVQDFAQAQTKIVLAAVHYATGKMAAWTARVVSHLDAFWKVQPEVECSEPEVDLYSGFSGAALMALVMPSGYDEYIKYDNGCGKDFQGFSLKG